MGDITAVCEQQIREVQERNEALRQQLTLEVKERNEHFRQQILEILRNTDAEVDWDHALVIGEAPTTLRAERISFQWRSDEEIPQWLRDGILGFEKSIS